MSEITPIFSNIWSIVLVILFFGGSIFVHELGHFLAARWRGVKVTRFSIGFGPKIVSWKGKDGVEYCLSWLPLGGYVALPQLADMRGLEGDADPDAPRLPPIDYTSKMVVFVAGAVFNVLFAFFLACVLWTLGTIVSEEEQSTRIGIARPTIEASGGKSAPGPAYTAGLRSGDRILSVDGKTVESFGDISQLVALGAGRDASGNPQVDLKYSRDGKTADAIVLPALVGIDELRDIGIEPAVKVTVGSVVPDSAAAAAGVAPDDIVTHLDGQPVEYASFVTDYLRDHGGAEVELRVLRDNKPVAFHIVPRKVLNPETGTEIYRLGIQLRGAYTTKKIHETPWSQLWGHAVTTWRGLASLLNPKTDVGLSKMSGPVGIARIFYTAAQTGIRVILWFTILVNVNLAMFNLLPIPVLDGGHMLFATIARLRGRSLPEKLIMTTQSVFMALLLTMILYVSFFDIRRPFLESRSAAAAAGAKK